jgi:hemerythrin-like domain-containing protein
MLSDANKRWHDVLDTSYQAFLEALTALDLTLADDHWHSFKRSLSEHIEFEETHIEPLAKKWENNTLKLIQSDHLILKRLMPKLDRALAEIQKAGQPRTMLVQQLNNFIKMRNVLEHHDLREMEVLYPLLDAELEKKQCDTLANKMDEARQAL